MSHTTHISVKLLAAMLSLMLLFQILPQPHASAAGSPSSILSSDSYWKMTMYSNDPAKGIIYEYYVELGSAEFSTQIVSTAGDDLRYGLFTWNYDPEIGILNLSLLQDPYANDMFLWKDGKFVCEGAYYRTEMVNAAGAKSGFENALNSFHANYGSYNPVKRLVVSNSHFRYRDVSEWGTMPYESFRYAVNFKCSGLVMADDGSVTSYLEHDLSTVLGRSMPNKLNYTRVFFDAQLPDNDIGQFNASRVGEVMDLVYPKWDVAYNAFETLQDNGEKLLSAPATGRNITATDIYEGAFFWNNEEAVTIFRIGQSVIIFRGPTQDIKYMTEYLDLGSYLWY